MQLLVYILVRVHFMMHTVDELEGPVWHSQHLARMKKWSANTSWDCSLHRKALYKPKLCSAVLVLTTHPDYNTHWPQHTLTTTHPDYNTPWLHASYFMRPCLLKMLTGILCANACSNYNMWYQFLPGISSYPLYCFSTISQVWILVSWGIWLSRQCCPY